MQAKDEPALSGATGGLPASGGTVSVPNGYCLTTGRQAASGTHDRRFVAIVAFAAVMLAGCGKKDIAPKPIASAPAVTLKGPPRPTTPNLPVGTPEFTLSANDFYAEYTKPNSLAHQKYRGKTIDLTGTVKTVATNTNGTPILYLEAGGDPLGVLCMFDKMDEDFGEKVSRGQQVRIRGKWPLHSQIGCLTECQIVGR